MQQGKERLPIWRDANRLLLEIEAISPLSQICCGSGLAATGHVSIVAALS
jgi:hypothetical protein